MSQVFFEDLELPHPDIHLGVGSGTHAEQTGKVMIEFEKVLLQQKPNLVVVVGDVNSTLAAALAAVKMHIPVAHVEAGVRCYDMNMPEEVNRLLTDHISDYLFTTSKYDNANLRKEGIACDKIFCVGNVMVDSLLFAKKAAEKSNVLSRLGLHRKGYALLTLHRPSNVDNRDSFLRIISAVKDVSQKIPIVFPAHPRTQKKLHEFNLNLSVPVIASPDTIGARQSNLLIIPPLGYLDFLNLEMNSEFVMTDSGGIQVETTIFGIPCLTMLDTPVWAITHEQGTNILVGSDCKKLISEVSKILNSKSNSKSKSPALWDGKTAERIVRVLTLGTCAKNCDL